VRNYRVVLSNEREVLIRAASLDDALSKASRRYSIRAIWAEEDFPIGDF